MGKNSIDFISSMKKDREQKSFSQILNNFNQKSSSKSIFEEAKSKQIEIPHITLIAIRSILLGIILMLLLELYFIIIIKSVDIINLIINISLTIVVFFIATSYVLYEMEKINRDVKDSHEIIETLINTLELRIKKRTKEVQELLNQKDEFINSLSHDLKNPLCCIIGLLQLLSEDETTQEKKEIFTIINRNVDYIQKLTSDTLELAQLQTPTPLIFETVNLHEIAGRVIEKNKILLLNNNIEIYNFIDDTVNVPANTMRLEEVFYNLIGNAIKFSFNGGTITLDTKKDENNIIVNIKDTGRGMEKIELKKVFDEFYKADRARHDLAGHGLGMTICKRIIEKHGGEIWVESKGPGLGSTFSFTLPLSQQP